MLTRKIKVGAYGDDRLRVKYIDATTNLPIDFTGSLGVTLRVLDRSGAPTVDDLPADFDGDPTAGTLGYDWDVSNGELDVAGAFTFCFVEDMGGGKVRYWPKTGHHALIVEELID